MSENHLTDKKGMKLNMFSLLLALFFTFSLNAEETSKGMTDDTFTSGHKLCRASVESAQKSSYLRTIGSVKKCRRPKIANPVTPWRCEELDPDDYEGDDLCEKKFIKCEREYDCRFLTVNITKKYIEENIKKGNTGTFFPRKLSRETSSE